MSYSPKPGSRHYVRNIIDGNRGYLVEKNGKTMVRLDRPQEIVLPFNGDWKEEEGDAPYPVSYLAQVAYAADRRMLVVLGRHGDAKKDWMQQPERFRVAWIEEGPKSEEGFGDAEGDMDRARLYLAIMRVLRPLGR